MNIEIVSAVIGAVVGGFLAAGAGLLVEYRKNVSREKKLRALFKTAIIDDLKNSLNLYEKIQEEWSKSNLIWFVTLDEIRKSRRIYEKFYEHILLFKSEDLRQKVFKYYQKSETLIASLGELQKEKYRVDNERKNLLTRIRAQTPSISDEAINGQVKEAMKDDQIAIQWVNDELTRSINKLNNIIGEAQNLLDKISSEY
jgi:hypothetical protein